MYESICLFGSFDLKMMEEATGVEVHKLNDEIFVALFYESQFSHHNKRYEKRTELTVSYRSCKRTYKVICRGRFAPEMHSD